MHTKRSPRGKTGTVIAFLATLTILAGIFLTGIYAALPANILTGYNRTSWRSSYGLYVPQAWNFFTRDPTQMQFVAYGFGSGKLESLMSGPQARPENLIGLSRTQRAQGPELGIIYQDKALKWHDCDDWLSNCWVKVPDIRQNPIINSSPIPTICGDVLFTQETVVPWSYRLLTENTRRVSKIAKAEVECKQ